MEKGVSTTLAQVIDQHSRQQSHWFADPLLKEEGGNAWIFLSLWGIFGVLLIVIVAGTVWSVEQRIVATGRVIAQGDMRTIQLFEGGNIASVLVSPGQLVESGQALLVMDTAKDQLEHKKLKSHYDHLLLKERVYRTLLTGHVLDGVDSGRDQATLDDEMRAYYDQERVRYLAKLTPIKQQITELSSHLKEEQSSLYVLQKKKIKFQEALEAKQVLLQKGFITHKQLNTDQQNLSEVTATLEQVKASILAGKQALDDIQQQFQRAKEEAKSQWTKQLTQVVTQQTKVLNQIEQADERIRQMTIKSPIRGVIQTVRSTENNHVAAGGIVAEVVPLNQSLMVEVKVDKKIIKTLQVGQEVLVAIATFNFNNSEAVQGKVKSLPNTTFVNEAGSPYQKVIIGLATDSVGNQASDNKILPGMTVRASISIGYQPILNYLFKPLWQQSKQHAGV
ncbi:HlyD family type I secretion periplasmic adaptor subunit [Zooshikella harenae]|uniref:Membrane fusion protein (MFP) family protein n=1 Tax=Zooshikella harenae TaxID=2827238 RepID=A0ABS5ZFD6_9GAMM|nr:HlyD family type I secretion periplasmic adaptor subunit [Zooshikella harenae]MBU2712778.1 HlyD family type I secretion periplasmic adaptor subunit [Zooshikella harenae]